MTLIPHPLQSAALSRPHHPALRDSNGVLNYGELRAEVQSLAGHLQQVGIGPGDTVALMGTYDSQWVIGLHAIGWLGAVALPLHVDMPLEEARVLANSCHVKLWLVDDARRDLLASSEVVLCLLSVRGACVEDETFWGLDDTRLMVATSGSTGAARVIALTTGQLCFSAMGSMIRLGHTLRDTWLCALPLNHVGGLSILVRALWASVTVELAWPFGPEHFAQRIRSGEITLCSMVPEMLRRVMAVSQDEPLPESLRAILVGGDSCPGDVLDEAKRRAYPLALTWGMTESASQVATRFPGDFSEHGGNGPSLSFARVQEREGTLVIQGPVAPQGTLATSDRGFVDERGCVHVLGRTDDVLISGGENITPRKVEDVILKSSWIESVAVVGVHHSRWGQRPVAFVVPAQGSTLTDDSDLRQFLVHHLNPFEVPDAFFRVERLPQSGIGKLDRKALRSLAAALGLGHQVKMTDSIHQFLGNCTRLEGCKVDDDVDQLAGAAQIALGSEHAIIEGNGCVADLGNGDLDGQFLSESHRPLVVGVGVDEGHAPFSVVENVGDAVAHRNEELLENVVTVLVSATEESDPSAVDLIETNSDDMLKSHGCSGNQSEGICDESL